MKKDQESPVEGIRPCPEGDVTGRAGARHWQLLGIKSHIAWVVEEMFKRTEVPFYKNRGLYRAFG